MNRKNGQSGPGTYSKEIDPKKIRVIPSPPQTVRNQAYPNRVHDRDGFFRAGGPGYTT